MLLLPVNMQKNHISVDRQNFLFLFVYLFNSGLKFPLINQPKREKTKS